MIDYEADLPDEVSHEMWDEITRRKSEMHEAVRQMGLGYPSSMEEDYLTLMWQAQFLRAKVRELYDLLSNANAEILDLKKEFGGA